MRFASVFTGTALGCVVQGLAIDPVARSDDGFSYATMTFSSDNFCGKTTFQHTTSSGAPLLGECEMLMQYFNSDRKKGFEFIGWDQGHLDSGYLQLGVAGGCALGAKPLDANDGPPVVTWGDAADVIKMAIHKFTVKGSSLLVEGLGTMECKNLLVLALPKKATGQPRPESAAAVASA
ncbi:hypothetical protein O1611_g2719 [Lasiodiplodia mahajangana]|uniref:Uncharacterized protein n=1 Tax=Lasiodiplodia mahajangana TaxID=1108764 RepID=A0ACC2JU32_9PEZI|nr:hypothetical protein O1611_g2719 [Lasiodiplodia mahajangana]